MKGLKYLFYLFLFASCINNQQNFIVVHDKMIQSLPGDSSVKYFPYDSVQINANILEDWGNKVLFSAREPLLNKYIGEGDFLRLTWLRSFENPIVVRVNRFGDTLYINLKELNLYGVNTPIILRDTIINIKKEEWDEIMLPVSQNSFWQSSYTDIPFDIKDGVTWFLECRLNNRYRVIQRWDDGYFLSSEFIQYVMPLIQYLESYIDLKSKR